MVKNKTHIALLASLGLLCAFPSVAVAENWIDEMARIDAQVQLLRKRMELRTELERASAGELSTLPKVVSVFEVDGKKQARLLYQDGRKSVLGEDDVVINGVRIAAINDRAVMVVAGQGKKKTAVMSLDFALIGNAATPGGAGHPGSPGLPSIPAGLLPPPPPINLSVNQ